MKFDPEKSLFELPAVKMIGTYTVVLAAIVVAAILSTSTLSYQPGYQGINNLIEIFKIPLGILAIGLSLIGLCGANHRSEQTKRQIERTAKQIDLSTLQIEATKSQNNFSNYYKHAEEFTKLCARIKGINSVNSPQKLHTKLFPKAQQGDFSVSKEMIAELENYGNDIRGVLLEMANNNDIDQMWTLHKINYFFVQRYWLSPVAVESEGKVLVREKMSRLRVPQDAPRGYIKMHMDFIGALDEIFAFDIKYQSPKIISTLSTLGLGFVPDRTDLPASINFPDLIERDVIPAKPH